MTLRRSSAAVGLALVLAAGAAEAQQRPAPPDGRPGQEAPRGGAMRRDRGPGRALMRGVTLTDAQREQLRAINQKYQGEAQSLRTAMRPAMDEARAARQRGDTAAVRRAWERTAGPRRDFAALQERRVAEMRGVLTEDQRRQFDANRAAVQARMQARMQERRQERGGDAHGPERGPRRGGPRGGHGR